ncbi:hypothetical protein MTBLM5_300010 [Magnetospirillum sp. LM-5]|nr:hypothetical protein MTBLM5_300010 [Magnetospirillum sp. LM-5]
MIQSDVSTGLENKQYLRENSAHCGQARVSSQTRQRRAELWDIQSRDGPVEPVFFKRMASPRGFEPLSPP